MRYQKCMLKIVPKRNILYKIINDDCLISMQQPWGKLNG
jgi:hypothetical protein